MLQMNYPVVRRNRKHRCVPKDERKNPAWQKQESRAVTLNVPEPTMSGDQRPVELTSSKPAPISNDRHCQEIKTRYRCLSKR